MSRQTRRRRQLQEPVPELVDRPINESRLRQQFTNLTCRRRPVLDGIVLSGIEVEASSPEEMVAKSEAALVQVTRQQRPS